MKPQPKIKLTAWAARKWDPPPCKRTLVNWSKRLQIQPPPEKIGRTYFVDPGAQLVSEIEFADIRREAEAWIRAGIKKPAQTQRTEPSEPLPWIERIRRDSAHIHKLSLEELRALPVAPEYCAGIYFLWNGDHLQYIGKSKHVQQRLVDHERQERIPHDRHTCLVLDLGRVHCPSLGQILQDHERAYIAEYPTPFNCRYYTPGT